MGDQCVHEGDDRGDDALGDEDVLLDAELVELLQERRQITLAAGDLQRPLDGPASQVSMPPSEAEISITAAIGVIQPTWKYEKKASKALHHTGGQAQLMSRHHSS
ncbi:hypothetical protein [Streptomyces sp. KL116D]|uniref:hypothetical protein n=1 Tax=Streptomyces sp. KL116D TaxID=3045152 RepID=UPI003555E8A0